jgi:hypothetical protein
MLNAIKEQQEIIRKQQMESQALRAEIQKEHARTNAQQARLELQQKQIAQLASQVTVIQASLKAKPRSRRTVRVAKSHVAPPPTRGSLPVAHVRGSHS